MPENDTNSDERRSPDLDHYELAMQGKRRFVDRGDDSDDIWKAEESPFAPTGTPTRPAGRGEHADQAAATSTDGDAGAGLDPDVAAKLDDLERRTEAVVEQFERVLDGDSTGTSDEVWGRNSPFHPGP